MPQPKKPRPTLRAAVEWIALNDDALEMDADVIAGSLTVVLVADVFGTTPENVARKIISFREQEAEAVGAR